MLHSNSTPNPRLGDSQEEYIAPMSSRYWAIHFSPSQYREAVLAVYCFAHLMANLATASPDVIAEKSVWWHDELQRLEQKESRHPVTQSLQSHLTAQPVLDPAYTPLVYQQLHQHLHGALMTQQGTAIDSFEDWQSYAEMRLGAIHSIANLLAGKSADDAIEHGQWVGQIGLLSLNQNASVKTDPRFLPIDTTPWIVQNMRTIHQEFEHIYRQRPAAGSVASEIILQHDINWWRKPSDHLIPSVSNQALGIKGLFSSWHTARKYR